MAVTLIIIIIIIIIVMIMKKECAVSYVTCHIPIPNVM